MMPAQRSEKAEVKMYSDFKSPYAFLAFDPGMTLEQRFDVRVRWIPFQLRVKGKGERSVYSEYKVKYSYLDARRWAKPRGLWIRGPLKVYDTTPAAIGGVFAGTHGRLLDFGRLAFKKFFLREFEADQPEAVARLIAELGLSDRHYLEYLAGEGRAAYERCQEEAAADHVFGVPFFLFAGEPFWGYDRLALLEQRLEEAGLAIGDKVTAARAALGRRRLPPRGPLCRTWGFLVGSTQRDGDDCQIADANGLSRARHHPVRRRPDLHADNGRAGRRGHQAGAGAIGRSRPRLRRQAARWQVQGELAKHVLFPAQSLEKKSGRRYQASARP